MPLVVWIRLFDPPKAERTVPRILRQDIIHQDKAHLDDNLTTWILA